MCRHRPPASSRPPSCSALVRSVTGSVSTTASSPLAGSAPASTEMTAGRREADEVAAALQLASKDRWSPPAPAPMRMINRCKLQALPGQDH